MDKITLETDLLDRLEKASKYLDSLLTVEPIANQRPTKDISQSRFVTKDISARRRPTEIAKIKTSQPATDKLEQEFIKEFVSYFE